MLEITREQANYFTLTRQHLIEKAERAQFISTISDVCGVHAQFILPAILQIWTRVLRFRPREFFPLLYERRVLIRTWLMRGTLFVIPAKELPVYYQATRRVWLGYRERDLERNRWHSLNERTKILYPKLMELLENGKPLTRRQIRAKLLNIVPMSEREIGYYHLVKEAAYMGYVAPGPPERLEATAVRIDKWFPGIHLNSITEAEARKELVMKYLAAYGPAALQDCAYFSGIPISEIRPVWSQLKSRLTEVRISGRAEGLYVRNEDVEPLRRIGRKPGFPLIMLPKFDQLILGHKDKHRFMKEKYRSRIISGGDVAATFLVDGVVRGIWTLKKEKDNYRFGLKPFEAVKPRTLNEAEKYGENLVKLLHRENM